MPDLSHLDRKYFIDDKVYNCPFCNGEMSATNLWTGLHLSGRTQNTVTDI